MLLVLLTRVWRILAISSELISGGVVHWPSSSSRHWITAAPSSSAHAIHAAMHSSSGNGLVVANIKIKLTDDISVLKDKSQLSRKNVFSLTVDPHLDCQMPPPLEHPSNEGPPS